MVFTVICFGQWNIGKTIDEVKATMEAGDKIEDQTKPNGPVQLVLTNNENTFCIGYVFNDQKKCYLSALYPFTLEAKSEMHGILNEYGTRLKSEKWQDIWLLNEDDTFIIVTYIKDDNLGYYRAQPHKK